MPCGQGRFAKLLGRLSKKEDRKRKSAAIDDILDNVDFENNAEETQKGK